MFDNDPTEPTIWQGRHDTLPNERFFQYVTCIDRPDNGLIYPKKSWCFLGFCSDEGIKRNEGRPGAKTGPNAIRHQLAGLAVHDNQRVLDAGNIDCQNGELETAQHAFGTVIASCHEHGLRTIGLGGGHEIAWAHYQGLKNHYPRLGIINLDAHFDIRPLKDDKYSTSGTPFWQIHHDAEKNNRSFDYACLGIQKRANTNSLFERASQWGVRWLSAEQIKETSWDSQRLFLDQFMHHHDSIYLSICLDAFAQSIAPGVSAPQAFGLTLEQACPLLKYIGETGKVVAIDIAELSPALDREHQTARLAAGLLADLLIVTNYKEQSA